MLSQQEPGSFVVRDSFTHLGCYALSVKLPASDSCSSTDIAHYLITRTSRGMFKLKVSRFLPSNGPQLHRPQVLIFVDFELFPTLPCDTAHLLFNFIHSHNIHLIAYANTIGTMDSWFTVIATSLYHYINNVAYTICIHLCKTLPHIHVTVDVGAF